MEEEYGDVFHSVGRVRFSLFVRILAWIKGGTPVFLMDFEGEIYCSFARKSPFGIVTASVYPTFGVGNCILLPDGTVSERSESSYIKKWSFV